MNKYIVILNGPICSGKTTVTKLLMKKDNVFHGSYDQIKWLISNYSGENELHREIAKELTFSMVLKALELGFSVVVDGGNKDYRDKYKELAKKYNHIYLSINIEAPLEILEKRFLDRVASAKERNSKNIAVTTVDGFQSRYQWYINTNKDITAKTFDSSKLSPEEILSQIEELIN
jgi:predicted kinase